MTVLDAIRNMAERLGIDDNEIDAMLTDATSTDLPDSIDFSSPIPGRLGDEGTALEIFSSDVGPALESKSGELLWYPMIREGQWAVRPGPQGQKKKSPLKVVSGKSKNQRKEIGLQDLVEAFNEGAVEYVTIPENHDNKALDNTGFIRGMKIAKAPIQTGPKKGTMAATLFGGYHFTSAKAKEKVAEGSVAGRSCGILYDYINTETGKSYPAVVEHVALTNKPWITGMIPFGRKLSGVEGFSIETMRLSDDEPPADVIEDPVLLSEWADAEGLKLAKGDVVWDSQKSLSAIQEKAREALQVLRQQHRNAMRAQSPGSYVEYSEDFPSWCVRDCTADAVLIADGYGDGADMWKAPYKWDSNGEFELSAFTDWVKVKQVLVEDATTDTVDTTEVESDQPTTVSDDFKTPRGRLELAQAERRIILATTKDKTGYQKTLEAEIKRLMKKGMSQAQATAFAKNSLRKKASAGKANYEIPSELFSETTHPRGGGKQMKEDTPAGGSGGGLQLSEEARKQIEAAEERAKAAEDRAERLSETVSRLNDSVVERDTDSYIEDQLKKMGFDEEHGFGGALTVLRDIFNADDGGPAVVSEKFSEDGKAEVELSVTDAFKRFFKAIEKGEDGKIKLGAQVTEPSTTDGDGEEGETKVSTDGKPAPEGKNDKEKLSTEEKIAAGAKDNPEFSKLIGVGAEAPKAAGSDNNNGGEAK